MRLWYENSEGETLDLLNSDYWVLDSQDGLTSLPDNIINSRNTILTEGAFVQNRRREARQIVLNHTLHKHVRDSRRRFVEVLDQEAAGKVYYEDDELNVYIPVEVESCEIDNTKKLTTVVTTFLAPYPYFYDTEETRSYKQAIQGAFAFPFSFPITFGTTNASNVTNIENTGEVDVGFSFILTAATGNVSNVRITNQLGEYVRLSGITFVQGDKIEFSSIDNSKYIKRIRAGASDLNLLGYFSGDFFKLRKGGNRLTLSANGSEHAKLEVIVRAAHKAV